MDQSAIKQQLEKFFAKKLDIVFDKPGLDRDTDLLEAGVLDSLSFLVLTSFIEKQFKVKPSLDAVSLNQIVSYIDAALALKNHADRSETEL